jgi:tRNA (guanine-N7-)-methyltransferase
MPHLKVEPFDTERFNRVDSEHIKFRAVSNSGDEVLGVRFLGREFILELKKRGEYFLIKPDKITRPINVELIKKVLSKIAEELSLKILNSNLEESFKKRRIPSKYDKSVEDFIGADFGFPKVSVEVGFGSGRHLLHQANRNPDTLFIGIEIHTPSALQVLKQIELQNIDNIWIVNYDARLLLEILPSNLLESIYVHFPVPWDKKPHRRVINHLFLKEVIRVLKVDGELEIKTDSQNYYLYSLKMFDLFRVLDFRVQKNVDLEIISKYEARWRREGRDIYTLTLRNSENSPPKKRFCQFDFENVECKGIYVEPRKDVFKRYFLNIEELFRLVGEDGKLLKVSFGSFDRPEHKYILISDSKVKYIPNIPVPTDHNCESHKKIKEILCQA